MDDSAVVQRERYLEAVVEMQARLLQTEGDHLGAFNHALAPLGEASGASRVYLFENLPVAADGVRRVSQRAEWCAPGVHPEIDNPALQAIAYEEFVPAWYETLSRGGRVERLASGFTALEQAILGPQSVLSLLVIPLMVDEEFTGFIGFDNCVSEVPWTRIEVNLLSAAATQIGLMLAQRRARRELLAANAQLEGRVRERTADLEAKNERLAEALRTLHQTQEQLVMAEKMASLGLMVAGIAHELKNPLNFVNNFAELSIEFVDEIEGAAAELRGGASTAALVEVLPELAENLRRIQEHGRRADGIIAAMLLHAREQAGEAAPLDLNDVVRAHVVLAYQGFRAHDREFRAEIVESFGDGLAGLALPYAEVARVVMNLVANACYATRERLRRGEPGYLAVLTVTTARVGDFAELRIADNGVGIPDAIARRIFEPFFTTKPPGEGTGLGLSISYDVVVKQLGGQIEARSTLGEGAEFVVRLPVGASASA